MSDFLGRIEQEITYANSQIERRKDEIQKWQSELAAYNNVKRMYKTYLEEREADIEEV